MGTDNFLQKTGNMLWNKKIYNLKKNHNSNDIKLNRISTKKQIIMPIRVSYHAIPNLYDKNKVICITNI